MTLTGIGINPTTIINTVAAGSLAEAEAKLKNIDDVMRMASKEWEAFTAKPAAKAFNAGRALSTKECTELVVGVIKLVRGTVSVLVAEQAALAATLQALKTVNMKR